MQQRSVSTSTALASASGERAVQPASTHVARLGAVESCSAFEAPAGCEAGQGRQEVGRGGKRWRQRVRRGTRIGWGEKEAWVVAWVASCRRPSAAATVLVPPPPFHPVAPQGQALCLSVPHLLRAAPGGARGWRPAAPGGHARRMAPPVLLSAGERLPHKLKSTGRLTWGQLLGLQSGRKACVHAVRCGAACAACCSTSAGLPCPRLPDAFELPTALPTLDSLAQDTNVTTAGRHAGASWRPTWLGPSTLLCMLRACTLVPAGAAAGVAASTGRQQQQHQQQQRPTEDAKQGDQGGEPASKRRRRGGRQAKAAGSAAAAMAEPAADGGGPSAGAAAPPPAAQSGLCCLRVGDTTLDASLAKTAVQRVLTWLTTGAGASVRGGLLEGCWPQGLRLLPPPVCFPACSLPRWPQSSPTHALLCCCRHARALEGQQLCTVARAAAADRGCRGAACRCRCRGRTRSGRRRGCRAGGGPAAAAAAATAAAAGPAAARTGGSAAAAASWRGSGGCPAGGGPAGWRAACHGAGGGGCSHGGCRLCCRAFSRPAPPPGLLWRPPADERGVCSLHPQLVRRGAVSQGACDALQRACFGPPACSEPPPCQQPARHARCLPSRRPVSAVGVLHWWLQHCDRLQPPEVRRGAAADAAEAALEPPHTLGPRYSMLDEVATRYAVLAAPRDAAVTVGRQVGRGGGADAWGRVAAGVPVHGWLARCAVLILSSTADLFPLFREQRFVTLEGPVAVAPATATAPKLRTLCGPLLMLLCM